MFAAKEKTRQATASAAPRLEDSPEYVAAFAAHRDAVAAHQRAEAHRARVHRDLFSTDMPVVLRARRDWPDADRAELIAHEQLEHTRHAFKQLRDAAFKPVAEFHLRQAIPAALAAVRDELRRVDRGAMRRLLDAIDAARAAGVYVDASDLVPSLWRTETGGASALDVWQKWHERNGNL